MAHNLVYFNSNQNTIQKFSNAQLDNLAERVLRVMAAGTYTGSISVGTTASIGTFADTALVGAAGSADTSTVTNTYTLSQVATATLGASADPPMYVGLDTTSPTQTVLQENLTTKEQLADEIISRMVASTGGTNAYYLASSAPADGATWVSRGTLLDTITNNTVTVTDYKLWHRTTSGEIITDRDPVKLSSGNIQNFSTAEIEALIKTIEERIVATGIGTYVLQASAPVTGTWSNVGSIVDTREDITTSNFSGEVGYVNENAIAYTSTYTGIPQFTNPDGQAFAGFATFTNLFTGLYTGSYAGAYLGAGPTYLGPGPSYTGGASFTSDATYLGPASYLGPATYTGTVSYSGQVTYLGPGTYTGGPFPFSPGVIPTPQGQAPNFFGTRSFTNPNAVPFLGPVTNYNLAVDYNATGVPFTNPDATPFVGPGPSFLSPPGPFVNVDGAGFINPDGISFSGTYDGTTFISVAYEADYLGAASYLGPVTYDSIATDYDSTVYSGTDTYTGTVAYEGTRVAPTTSTISTRTLWRRIA